MKRQSRTSRKPVRRSRSRKRAKLWRWVIVGAVAAWLMHLADSASWPSAAVNMGSQLLNGSYVETASGQSVSGSSDQTASNQTVSGSSGQTTSSRSGTTGLTGGSPTGGTGTTGSGAQSSAVNPGVANPNPVNATGWVVQQSFNATSAVPSGYEVHNWSLLNEAFVSDDELTNTARVVVGNLGLQSPRVIRRDTRTERYLQVYGELRPNTQASVFLSTFNLSRGRGYSVIIVRVDNQDGQIGHFQDDVQAVTNAVKDLSLIPNISACIQGTLNARLLGGQLKQIALQAAQSVDATTFEGVQSSDLTSLSGYTPWQPKYITTGTHKMNLQVAVHYDSYHHRTNVLVGTPIITTTY